MPALFLQSRIFPSGGIDLDLQNVRECRAMPLGDMEEGLMEMKEQDTEQGILEPWQSDIAAMGNQPGCINEASMTTCPLPTWDCHFPAMELRAYLQWCEAALPDTFLLEQSRNQSRVVARIELSTRRERVFDKDRLLVIWMAISRRERARKLKLPCFPPCASCGIDTSLQCPGQQCNLSLCFFCLRDWGRCLACAPADPTVPSFRVLDWEV